MAYVIQDGERINIDHLPPSTISYLLRAGVEVKEDEEGEVQQKFEECAGCLLDCPYATPYNQKEKAFESSFKGVYSELPEEGGQ
jgi:hypothetical protein